MLTRFFGHSTKLSLIPFFFLLPLVISCQTPDDEFKNVTLLGEYNGEERWGAANGVALRENYAFVAAERGLRVVDLSDYGNPVDVTPRPTSEWLMASKIQLWGNYAYLTSHNNLLVYDLTDPRQPDLKSRVSFFERGSEIAINQTGIYVVDRHGLHIFSHSHPEAPERIAYHEFSGKPEDVAVRDSVVFVASWSDGLYVINPTDTSDIKVELIAELKVGHLALEDSILYALASNELVLLDLADPTRPVILGRSSCRIDYDFQVCDGVVYAATDHHGLALYDVPDAANATQLGYYKPGNFFPHAVGIVDQRICVTVGEYYESHGLVWGGIQIYDCSLMLGGSSITAP